MELTAQIEKVFYRPLLCKSLQRFSPSRLGEALEKKSSFILAFRSDNEFAVSHWVSPKRTRSYPYVRVYDTLGYTGTRVTVIPVIKDEGLAGDGSGERDFVQWDTISLMSLLNVYVILSYYEDAVISIRYPGKITRQKLAIRHIEHQLDKLAACKSSALHWNMEQVTPSNLQILFNRAMESYESISKNCGIRFHSRESALNKILKITKSRDSFLQSSRTAAYEAQQREVQTVQPKEKTKGDKKSITIRNYLGGEYFLTVDEFMMYNDNIKIVEAKHTRKGLLPSWNDIKDGLFKMVLFTNLTNVVWGNLKVNVDVVLKLTSPTPFNLNHLGEKDVSLYRMLIEEAHINGFRVEH